MDNRGENAAAASAVKNQINFTQSKAKYFVSLEIKNQLSDDFSLYSREKKKIRYWERTITDPFLERINFTMDKKNLDLKSLILVPKDSEFAINKVKSFDALYQLDKPLEEKRKSTDYRLVTKKIIKYGK